MKKEKKLSRGFTVFEILIVLTIIATLSSIIVTSFSQFRNTKILDTGVENTVSILAKARGNTLSSKNSFQYGVHLEATQVVLFRGGTYTVGDSNNEVSLLDSSLEISTIALTGGGSNVIFDRLTGKTSQGGTIIIRVKSDVSKTKTITINGTGLVSMTDTTTSASYAFSEGAGPTTADSSGNGNTGTLTNDPLWVAGKNGNGLFFDGMNSYVVIPNTSSVDIGGTDLTISMWAKIISTSSLADYILVAKPWNASTMSPPYFQYDVEYDNNENKTVDFYFGDTTSTNRGPYSVTPPVDTWTHIAFTYDGTSVKGYLDGVQEFSTPTTGSIQARGQSLRLGTDGQFYQNYYGSLDDVRIYNRALTQAEIQTDMNTPL